MQSGTRGRPPTQCVGRALALTHSTHAKVWVREAMESMFTHTHTMVFCGLKVRAIPTGDGVIRRSELSNRTC